MTQHDFNTEILSTYTGRIMRKVDASAFRIAICLGPTKDGRKLRICVWSDNSRKWSKPQTRYPSQLEAIDLDALTAGQRRAVGHAINDVGSSQVGQHNWVRWSGGAQVVGPPWLNIRWSGGAQVVKAVRADGVTKLAGVQGTVTKSTRRKLNDHTVETFSATPEGKTKLQKLNLALSSWAFGRKS